MREPLLTTPQELRKLIKVSCFYRPYFAITNNLLADTRALGIIAKHFVTMRRENGKIRTQSSVLAHRQGVNLAQTQIVRMPHQCYFLNLMRR